MTPARAAGILVACAAVLTFLPARHADSSEPATHAARVGLVFDVGGRGDKSFNDAAYAGLEHAHEKLGIDASYLEPVGSEDREAAMRLFAARGFDLVIGVGFIFSTDVERVARDYPNVNFACIDYAPGADGPPVNVQGLTFREAEGAFLVGAVAGLVSKTHHAGFVGGMSGPLIRKFEVGYAAGVKATCPSCEVHAAYAGASPDAFRDPAKGKALAISEIAAGADVLFHASGSTGHGVFEAAKDAHVWAIGVDADQYDEMPGTILTSMIKRGDVAVFDTIAAVTRGEFRGGLHAFGLAEDGVGYVSEGPHGAAIPAEVRARVLELRAAIGRGAIKVPAK